MLSIVLVCALLTYGGVSLFVVVFAVYPFAAELFRQSDIPKRLIPGTIALGAFTFTMDALPGTPQIQNIIPTTFFGTDTWAAPWLGTHRRRVHPGRRPDLPRLAPPRGAAPPVKATATDLRQRTGAVRRRRARRIRWSRSCRWCWSAWSTSCSRVLIPRCYGDGAQLRPGGDRQRRAGGAGSVEGRRDLGGAKARCWSASSPCSRFAWKPVMRQLRRRHASRRSAARCWPSMNTASEYGFGAVIAALPGFLVVANALAAIPNPLVNEAITVTALAGITGSASGGMSIALAAMAETFIANANAAGIPMEVLHRVAAMASGGMDTLPHNGAVITLLAVTGLTHRQAYKDIFAITLIKTAGGVRGDRDVLRDRAGVMRSKRKSALIRPPGTFSRAPKEVPLGGKREKGVDFRR